MSEDNKDLELKELEQFSGTEKYYGEMGVNLTEGVHYIMENGYAWLVTDMLAVIKSAENPKVNSGVIDGFLTIKLKVDGRQATAQIEDGNGHVLYSQEYKWTDAKRDLVLYFTDNVLMLANEW